jgi:hypothetical protein
VIEMDERLKKIASGKIQAETPAECEFAAAVARTKQLARGKTDHQIMCERDCICDDY